MTPRRAVYTLPLPPSKNRSWAPVVIRQNGKPTARLVKTTVYKRWREEAAWQIRAQCQDAADGPCRVTVAVSLRRKNADAANVLDAVLDALEEGGAIVNDKLVYEWGGRRLPDTRDGSVVATVELLEPDAASE